MKSTQKIDAFEIKYKWAGLQQPKSLASFMNQYDDLVDEAGVITADNFWERLSFN